MGLAKPRAKEGEAQLKELPVGVGGTLSPLAEQLSPVDPASLTELEPPPSPLPTWLAATVVTSASRYSC